MFRMSLVQALLGYLSTISSIHTVVSYTPLGHPLNRAHLSSKSHHIISHFSRIHASKLASLDGIVVSGASIADINGLRGVVATAPIAANTMIVDVDNDLVLQVTNNREPTPFASFVSQQLWYVCLLTRIIIY
jgi:hypothetical protein